MSASLAFLLICPKCGKLLELPAIKPTLRIRPRKHTTVCQNSKCGQKIVYWQSRETSAMSTLDGVRRLCIYVELPGMPVTQGGSLHVCCPICKKLLILSLPKGKRVHLRTGLERTGFECGICSGKFSYWGQVVIPKACGGIECELSMKIPEQEKQRARWEHKIGTEDKWFQSCPQD